MTDKKEPDLAPLLIDAKGLRKLLGGMTPNMAVMLGCPKPLNFGVYYRRRWWKRKDVEKWVEERLYERPCMWS